MKSSQRNADLWTLAYPTLQSIVKMKEMATYQTSSESDSSSLTKSSTQSQCQSHFLEYEIIEMTQSRFESGFSFCFATKCANTRCRKTISCEESKHAPFFCWLIYIVYIYRLQNLHFPTTFISTDKTIWRPISIKSVDRILFKHKYR